MKKLITVLALIILICMTGCKSAPVKQEEIPLLKRRIEVCSPQDNLLTTIDNQETILELTDINNWAEVDKLPEGMIPRCKLLLYEDETLKVGIVGMDEREETESTLLETIITYKNSPFITAVMSNAPISGVNIPKGTSAICYKLSDVAFNRLNNLLEDSGKTEAEDGLEDSSEVK